MQSAGYPSDHAPMHHLWSARPDTDSSSMVNPHILSSSIYIRSFVPHTRRRRWNFCPTASQLLAPGHFSRPVGHPAFADVPLVGGTHPHSFCPRGNRYQRYYLGAVLKGSQSIFQPACMTVLSRGWWVVGDPKFLVKARCVVGPGAPVASGFSAVGSLCRAGYGTCSGHPTFARCC